MEMFCIFRGLELIGVHAFVKNDWTMHLSCMYITSQYKYKYKFYKGKLVNGRNSCLLLKTLYCSGLRPSVSHSVEVTQDDGIYYLLL